MSRLLLSDGGRLRIAGRLLILFVLMVSAGSSVNADENRQDNFSADVDFLRRHTEVLVLGAEEAGPRIAVVPQYQARVMTSTTGGPSQPSYGWINYAHIESGKSTPHINVYGGEERFWLGPEGGQYSIFFPPESKFGLEHWQVPAFIDTASYELVESSNSSLSFRHDARFENYAATPFRVRIDRTIEMISPADAESSLSQELGGLRMVGYRSTNRLTNIGKDDWKPETGLLSIWILGMYKPGPHTTVVIPFRPGPEAQLGPVVNDAYFGKPPAERLTIGDDLLFFSGDGNFRSKIGVSPQRARGVCGSWDADRGVLTILKYNQPGAEVTQYVNSMWEHQQHPYAGDAVNSYNDGPPAPGEKPLGPFYELETSSPALALAAGESGVHIEETYHFEGQRSELNALAQAILGASLDQIEAARN